MGRDEEGQSISGLRPAVHESMNISIRFVFGSNPSLPHHFAQGFTPPMQGFVIISNLSDVA
jgi:hypothetical protein